MPDRRPGRAIRAGKPAGRVHRRLITLLLYASVLTAVTGVSAPAATAAPSSCRVGAYVTDLYGLDVSPRTINADFWLWSVCPTADLGATRRLDFVNAKDVTQSDRSVEKVGNAYWSQVKVSGTFRQKFDLSEYPFDKQDVKIRIEDSEYDASQFTYVADNANSGYDHAISLEGSRSGTSTCRFHHRSGARFGILGASLFSVVVSMRAASLTGTSFGVTPVDQVHLATLLYTLVGVGCTSYILYRWADPTKSSLE
ncbi:hypothetical protein ACIRBY_33870 [Streptomyces sp. NPDC096136]|uniref:hypothetical protein n=1 Tax=Streptomyces sp. NPDC096136 TaxID=3366076 RepID=UPI00380AFF08